MVRNSRRLNYVVHWLRTTTLNTKHRYIIICAQSVASLSALHIAHTQTTYWQPASRLWTSTPPSPASPTRSRPVSGTTQSRRGRWTSPVLWPRWTSSLRGRSWASNIITLELWYSPTTRSGRETSLTIARCPGPFSCPAASPGFEPYERSIVPSADNWTSQTRAVSLSPSAFTRKKTSAFCWLRFLNYKRNLRMMTNGGLLFTARAMLALQALY